jgi:hypothetical protein
VSFSPATGFLKMTKPFFAPFAAFLSVLCG